MTDWLLGTLVATSGLALLVLVVRESVRRHFGARVAYGLWLIPAARLVMPTLTQTVERSGPAASRLQSASQPIVATQAVAAPAAAEPGLLAQVGGFPTLLVAAWLLVAIGLFFWRMAEYRRDRATILAGCAQLGRIGSIRVVRSSEVRSPLAFGILDPVIAVPVTFESAYTAAEQRLAIEHELSHHRSGDLVANVFAFVLLCLQWFNPLAWVAHAAFRFDQEAACDARVLDKVQAADRAGYGRAIAKAASGRALLFASALDRRTTLQRRLKSMLNSSSTGKPIAGKVVILAAVAVALPLTATRATDYVDVPPPAPVAAAAGTTTSLAPAAPAAASLQSLGAAPAADAAAPVGAKFEGDMQNDQFISIDGQRKRWEDLTPAEKAEIRAELAKAKATLAETRIDRAEIARNIREALANVRSINGEEMRREVANARVRVAEAMREIDSQSDGIRRAGLDPEELKMQVRQSLKAVEAIDFDAITRDALASIDPDTIAASVAAAQESIARAQNEIEEIERRLDR